MSKLRKQVNKLIVKIKDGDTASKEKLFKLTYDKLKGVAAFYLTNKSDIEDTLVNAYLRVFRYCNSFDEKKDGYNWICRIVENEAKKCNSIYDKEHSQTKDLIFCIDDFEERIANNDEVAVFLSALGDYERELIYLRFWEELTYKEIAERLGKSTKAVQMKINRLLRGNKNENK